MQFGCSGLPGEEIIFAKIGGEEMDSTAAENTTGF